MKRFKPLSKDFILIFLQCFVIALAVIVFIFEFYKIVQVHSNANKTETVKEVKTIEFVIVEPINHYINASETEKIETESTIELVEYFDVPLSEDLQNHIFSLCEEYNIDPSIIIAMIEKESNYHSSSVGDGGNSLGLMQIQPRWHKDRMNKLGCTDLLDPYQNVSVGVDLFAELLGSGKSVEWALMAYNGGASYANKKASQGVISDYARTVLNTSKNLKIAV